MELCSELHRLGIRQQYYHQQCIHETSRGQRTGSTLTNDYPVSECTSSIQGKLVSRFRCCNSADVDCSCGDSNASWIVGINKLAIKIWLFLFCSCLFAWSLYCRCHSLTSWYRNIRLSTLPLSCHAVLLIYIPYHVETVVKYTLGIAGREREGLGRCASIGYNSHSSRSPSKIGVFRLGR